MRDLAGYLWLVAFLFVIPIGIGRAMGAPWTQIAVAFAVVLGLAALIAFTSGQPSLEMRLVWTAIVFMIGVIPGVPIVLLIMRLFGQWQPR